MTPNESEGGGARRKTGHATQRSRPRVQGERVGRLVITRPIESKLSFHGTYSSTPASSSSSSSPSSSSSDDCASRAIADAVGGAVVAAAAAAAAADFGQGERVELNEARNVDLHADGAVHQGEAAPLNRPVSHFYRRLLPALFPSTRTVRIMRRTMAAPVACCCLALR